MNWLIITGGTPPENALLQERLRLADCIIAVDGAADLLARGGITPHVLIGDFDTALKTSVEALFAGGTQIKRLPVHKNMTDTEAAMDFALDEGAQDITMLGALGMRVDHTLSNIGMLLRAYRRDVACRILDDTNELTVASGEYILSGVPGQTVSILPLTGDLVVTASGLIYPLEALELPFGSSRGVSNIMKSTNAHLSISGGMALIVRILKNA